MREKPKEWLTFWLFLFAYLTTLAVIFLDHFKFKILTFNLEIIFGIVLAGGIVLRILCRMWLRRFFSLNIIIKKDHEIVRKGLYKYIRHPMYLSILLIFIGFAGVFSSILGIIATLVLVLPVTLLRIKREEYYLKQKTKERYEDYMRNTKKLIPFIY
jgi:protein-S-isoprenylcysteine O-methyltransferase Ste14